MSQLEAMREQRGGFAEQKLKQEAWNSKREKDQREKTHPSVWKPRTYFESRTMLGSVGQKSQF